LRILLKAITVIFSNNGLLRRYFMKKVFHLEIISAFSVSFLHLSIFYILFAIENASMMKLMIRGFQLLFPYLQTPSRYINGRSKYKTS